MQCNIDAKGKAIRLISGIVIFILSLAGYGLLAFTSMDWLIYVAPPMSFAGLFMIFEARKGWCIVRAMGFKTPF